MGKRLYIAYGSNLNLHQMAFRCPTAKLIGTGVIEDYELQFRGCSGVASVAAKRGGVVPVALWDIRPKDEKRLDAYEGFPRLYYKQDLTVKMKSGGEIKAMAYIINPKLEVGIPSRSYIESIMEGYENCGLDMNILEAALDNCLDILQKKMRLPAKPSFTYDPYGEQRIAYGFDESEQEAGPLEEDDGDHYFDLKGPTL
jgi:hypothetical protein